MRLLVADTNVLLPGFLSAKGRRRKFLALCAYAAFHYYAAVGPAEQERLEQGLEGVPGSRLGGLDIGAITDAAADRRAFLAEQLPPLAPDDLLLVGSRPLFDEFEEKVVEVGQQIAGGLIATDRPAQLRRQLAAITGIVVPDFDFADIPQHTEGRDRDDDVVIETAFRGGAFAIVADDKKHISLDEDGTMYSHPETGAEITAYQFERFVRDYITTSNFDLDEVDPGLLVAALERS